MKRHLLRIFLVSVTTSLLLTACYEDGLLLLNSDQESNSISQSGSESIFDSESYSDSINYIPVTNYSASVGRLLASQCAQCHGTNGYSVNGWDSLAGEDDLVEEMLEIKAGDEDPIMQAQAHGYSETEIQAIAAWLETQPDLDSDEDE